MYVGPAAELASRQCHKWIETYGRTYIIAGDSGSGVKGDVEPTERGVPLTSRAVGSVARFFMNFRNFVHAGTVSILSDIAGEDKDVRS